MRLFDQFGELLLDSFASQVFGDDLAFGRDQEVGRDAADSVWILWEDGNFPGCKSAGVQGGERENRQLRYGRAAENKKRPVEKQVAALFCDADRTQTCNLLIRSQMLYSIKLRRRIANANVV